ERELECGGILAGRSIRQRPVVRFAVGKNSWRPLGCLALRAVLQPVGRREVESLATGPIGRNAEKTVRQAVALRRVRLHAVARMEEAEEHGAVRDAPSQTNGAGSMQWLVQRHLGKAVGVAGH